MRLVCLGALYSLHIFPGGYCYLSLHNWFLGDTQNYGGDTAWPWRLIRLDLAVHPDRAGSPSLNLTLIFSASRLNLVHIAMTTGSIDIWSCSLGINRSCYMNYLPEYSIFYWITLNECEFHLSLHSKLLCLHAALQLLTALVKKKSHILLNQCSVHLLLKVSHTSRSETSKTRGDGVHLDLPQAKLPATSTVCICLHGNTTIIHHVIRAVDSQAACLCDTQKV